MLISSERVQMRHLSNSLLCVDVGVKKKRFPKDCFLYPHFIEILIAAKDLKCSKDTQETKRTMCRFDPDIKAHFPLCKVLLR